MGHIRRQIVTNKSVSDDVVAVVEEGPVGRPVFIAVVPVNVRSPSEVQRHT